MYWRFFTEWKRSDTNRITKSYWRYENRKWVTWHYVCSLHCLLYHRRLAIVNNGIIGHLYLLTCDRKHVSVQYLYICISLVLSMYMYFSYMCANIQIHLHLGYTITYTGITLQDRKTIRSLALYTQPDFNLSFTVRTGSKATCERVNIGNNQEWIYIYGTNRSKCTYLWCQRFKNFVNRVW